MKTLQNNFTTLEQSKRLLALGVPVLTADCYFYVQEINGRNVCDTPNLIPYGMGEFGLRHWWTDRNNARYIPCWSVGRLIEIYNMCVDFDLDDGAAIVIFIQDESPIVQMMQMFEDKVGIMDFSKLED